MVKIISPAPGAGRGQARPAVSPALLAALAGRLTARDRWLLRMLLEHRVLTTTQITDLAYGGPRRAALRLSELYRLRAVDRFRPLAATGSSPYHWVLDQAGAEVLAAEDGVPVAQLGYRRDRALDIAFSPRLAHTAGANGFFAALARAARLGGGELACWWSERRCAAAVGRPGPPRRIRACGATPAAQGTDFFLEYDTGSEDLPRLAAKLTGYRELAARTQIATPVLFWLASGPRREQQFRALLAAAGPVPGVPVVTATPASAQAAGGPAAAAWLPAGQPGPRLRLGQVTAAVPGARPAAQPPAGDTGLAWHPPVPHPPPAAGFGGASQATQGRAVTGRRIAACAAGGRPGRRLRRLHQLAAPARPPRPSHAASSPPATPAPAAHPGAGRDLAVQPGPAAGRRRPGRPVHRRAGTPGPGASPRPPGWPGCSP